MALPIPNLDDQSFEQLLQDVLKRLPVEVPEWTDHNIHDPGITFIELFAWLCEMQLFQLNQITDRHLLKYLSLLGVKPKQAEPARVTVQLSSETPISVNSGTRIYARTDPSGLVFELDQDLDILPVSIRQILTYVNYQYLLVTEFNEPGKTYFYAFGEQPQENQLLYIGIWPDNAIKGKKMQLGFYLYEEDLPPIASHGREKMKFIKSVELEWSYWGRDETAPGSGKWQKLTIKPDDGDYFDFTHNAMIQFTLPEKVVSNKPPELPDWAEENYWIRCRLIRADYDIPPRIDRIIPNVVSATQGQTVKDENFRGSGLPGQTFQAQKFPLILGSQTLTVDGVPWQAVDDFDASEPVHRHYTLNATTGEFTFGDGINGAIPPKDSEILINYRFGGGVKGNVPAGMMTEIDKKGVTVMNPYPASGGRDAENIDAAFLLFKRDLQVPYRAVGREDIEYLVLNTPGLRVARAHVLLEGENTLKIIAVPYSLSGNPRPGARFKRLVCEHLNMHRLITTDLVVIDPRYVRVSVKAEITVGEGFKPNLVRDAVIEALDSFLSPIQRKPAGNAWTFGRPVYQSEVYEVIDKVEGVNCVMDLVLRGEEGPFHYSDQNIIIAQVALVYAGAHSIEIVEKKPECRR